jgi:hypothetical protein
VLRGGSWNNNPTNARAANRNWNDRNNRNNNVGFRVAALTLHGQSRLMGINRAYRRRVQTCSGDEGDFIQI